MDIKKLLKDFGDVAPEVQADALAKEIENKKEADAVIKPCEKKFYKRVDKKIELPTPKKVEESLNEERTETKNESVCSKLNRQMHETVDLWDLKSVLNDYECSYVTDLTKDGELFTAWFLHEKDDRGLTGKQIKDEKIYNEVAERLRKEFPNENIVVTSRQYKYAPEQKAEFMLLLPVTGSKEFNNLKPGDKFTMEGYKGTCEVVERTEDGNWECKAPTVGDGWTYFDLYVEDMDKVTLLVDESLNEEWVASGSYMELDIPSEVIDDICHSGSNDEAVAAACAGPLREQLDAFTDEEIDKAFREIGFDKSEEEINAMTRQEKEHYLVWDLAWSAFDNRGMEESFEDRIEAVGKARHKEVTKAADAYGQALDKFTKRHGLTRKDVRHGELTDAQQKDYDANVVPYGRILDLTAQKAARHDELSLNRFARSPIGKLLAKSESISEGAEFDYMLLDRLRTDCDYFLGNGNGYEKHLWAGNVEDQIAKMRELYNKVAEKPEWISMEDIDNYEKEMLAKRDAKNESSDKVYELEDKNGRKIWSHTKRMPGYKWTGKSSENTPEWNAKGDVPLKEAEEREVLPIKFVRVDDWNRPIFKAEGKKYYLSDVNNLFDYDATDEQVKEFYKDKDNLRELLTFHGYSVDSEPNGGMLKYDLKLV